MKRQILESAPPNLTNQFPSSWAVVLVVLVVVLCATGQHAAAQTSPCGPSKQISIPANSPPVEVIAPLGPNCPCIDCGCQFATFNSLSPQQSWTTVTSIGVMSFTGGMSLAATIPFDVTGLPLGVYCASFQQDSIASVCATISCDGNNPACPNGWQLVGTGTAARCLFPSPGVYTYQVTVTAKSSISLVDPVPDLVSGNAVMNGTQLQTLLTKGRNVNGVSADGVTQVVVRISTNSPGEQFKLTLLNDQQGQSSPNEDGALGNPGDTSFSQNQLTVAAGSTPDSNGLSYAFAVYRAPTDFARPITGGFKPGVCNGTSKTDDQLACRSVSIQVQDITANTNVGTTQITIVRPPLILIHGLWSDYGVWKNFYPLVTGRKTVDRRFYVGRVNYNNRIGSTITATDPALTPAGSMSRISGNSLGFTYNATSVADQIHALLGEFKNGGGTTPVGIAVAAIQVDIIGHSLGGVLARQLVLVPAFLDSSSNPTNNLNQGYIHKIITVGAPHLGSPLAPKLVDSTNYHVREFLEHYGYYSLNSVTFSGQTNPVPGAMAEIKGNGVADASRSSALQTLALSGPRTLPAALVAGNYTNWSSLDCGDGCTPDRIRKKAPNDPLAQSYTSTNYPNNFSAAPSNLNDGIVGITSQLNGPTSSTWLFPGLAHSPGIVGFTFGLGFTAPSELDSANATPSNPIAQTVVDLLNTPVTSPPFSQNSINP